jgi:oligopeptide/dipeptide ABC transporter ATP-binding protein
MSRMLLKICDLKCYFFAKEGIIKAVDGVDLNLNEGDNLGIVGESGCGKSVTALSVMRLIAEPPGKIVSGKIIFNNKNLLELDSSEMRRVRGKEISMIFQEPMTSLNPVFRVGDQIAESIRLHQGLSKKESLNKSVDMLKMVEIHSPELRIRDYPHQMSGGMRQRVMIAMALSCRPKLMIADEPTTALDVTTQAQVLELMQRLKEEIGTSIILITHDLGIIAENTQHVHVMYAGRIVEAGQVESLFKNPLHPYTIGLMKSIPTMNETFRKRLYVIPGIVPIPLNLPKGCKFNSRCPRAFKQCFEEEPPLFTKERGHFVRCWSYQ